LKLIYERFLGLLDEDKNATIDDVLRQEDINRVLSTAYPQVTPQEVEQAVIERLQAEEESAEIQDMIARFYNKFDELHEQSVQSALAKSPNRLHVKNEIKYKIPERWTRKFHKHDIIGRILSGEHHHMEERGIVNRQGVQTMRGHNRQGSNGGNADESLQAILQN
jgi:hypothetical protein